MLTTINFRIGENQKEELQALADQRDVNISIVLREIIEYHLEELKYFESKTNREDDDDIEIIYLD